MGLTARKLDKLCWLANRLAKGPWSVTTVWRWSRQSVAVLACSSTLLNESHRRYATLGCMTASSCTTSCLPGCFPLCCIPTNACHEPHTPAIRSRALQVQAIPLFYLSHSLCVQVLQDSRGFQLNFIVAQMTLRFIKAETVAILVQQDASSHLSIEENVPIGHSLKWT